MLKRSSIIATAIAAMSVGLCGSSAHGAEPKIRLIVNQENPQKFLAKDEVSELFLKKVTRWPDGRRAAPVDQPNGAEVTMAFCKEIHKKSAGAVKAYWEQKIFSGADVPPVVKASDAEVVAFVRANPGAVGYVSSDASVEGVSVLTVR